MRASRVFVRAGFLGVFAVAIVAGCSGSTDSHAGAACHAGDQQACTCANGSHGFAACVNDALAACQCAPPTGDAGSDASAVDAATSDASHEGGAAKTDAGFGQYMGPCTATSDCPMGGVCFSFMSKGMFCTHACMSTSDCEAPSPKCNPKGVCAVPD